MELLSRVGLLTTVTLSLLATLANGRPSHQPDRPANLTWALTPTNSTKQFRGLSPVSTKIVWVSGTGGTVLRTTTSGSSWMNVSPSLSPENATTFEFRDIQAWSAKVAVILSIGEGNASRIYLTHDGGKSWKPTFINNEPAAFYDCMAFENKKHGLAMSDPVNGKFRLIETWDGGLSLTRLAFPQHLLESSDSQHQEHASRRRLDAGTLRPVVWTRAGSTAAMMASTGR
jgi:photosystem II stability/assembly factor-like uncharacterized protein